MDMLIREIMESRATPGTSMKEQTIGKGQGERRGTL